MLNSKTHLYSVVYKNQILKSQIVKAISFCFNRSYLWNPIMQFSTSVRGLIVWSVAVKAEIYNFHWEKRTKMKQEVRGSMRMCVCVYVCVRVCVWERERERERERSFFLRIIISFIYLFIYFRIVIPFFFSSSSFCHFFLFLFQLSLLHLLIHLDCRSVLFSCDFFFSFLVSFIHSFIQHLCCRTF